MHISNINITNFRNLKNVELNLNKRFNLFLGKNGSGKTNFLEAIHVLSIGRSFRARDHAQIIQFEKEAYTLFGIFRSMEDTTLRVGLEKTRRGESKIRIAEKDTSSLSELARILPIQLIYNHSYDILEAEPQNRRQFLDWILFHVEPSFYGLWQRYKRALQQRNAALKLSQINHKENIQAWDKEISETGEAIHQLRAIFIQEWLPFFIEQFRRLLNLGEDLDVHITYKKGWSEEKSLRDALQSHFERDCLMGYTSQGIHRADLEFYLDKKLVKNILSRGQTKLFICGLLLSRSVYLYEKSERQTVFLIDDLPSELDAHSATKLLKALDGLGGQVLITGIEESAFSSLMTEKPCSMFHVEHGEIRLFELEEYK